MVSCPLDRPLHNGLISSALELIVASNTRRQYGAETEGSNLLGYREHHFDRCLVFTPAFSTQASPTGHVIPQVARKLVTLRAGTGRSRTIKSTCCGRYHLDDVDRMNELGILFTGSTLECDLGSNRCYCELPSSARAGFYVY